MKEVRVVERMKSIENLIRALHGIGNNGTEVETSKIIQVFMSINRKTLKRQRTDQDWPEGSGLYRP